MSSVWPNVIVALQPKVSHARRMRLAATFEPPLDIPNTGDRAADVREGVQRFARVLERYVRRNPEQWTVFEDFWRGSR